MLKGGSHCGAVLVEVGPLLADTTLKFYPAVFLANAMAAFVLNLVRRHCCCQCIGDQCSAVQVTCWSASTGCMPLCDCAPAIIEHLPPHACTAEHGLN